MKPPCLVLDRRYYPFDILNYKKAFLLTFRDSNIQVLEYHPEIYLHSVKQRFELPIVIRIDEIIDDRNIYVTPTRHQILIRDNYQCQYCGKQLTDWSATIDHVVPKSKGGQWSWHNLVTCCEKCNQAKGNQIWQPMNKPVRPEPFIMKFRMLTSRVDQTTFDVWSQYLPIKYRKMAKDLRKQILFREVKSA